jgi:hypothetical protein
MFASSLYFIFLEGIGFVVYSPGVIHIRAFSYEIGYIRNYTRLFSNEYARIEGVSLFFRWYLRWLGGGTSTIDEVGAVGIIVCGANEPQTTNLVTPSFSIVGKTY